ncbi:LysR family transcriptional regulator [Granulosicoccus antarcticus]|uniref:HTH-type transcriptional regulator DmlR n=1 Tax=Granulosicoccus antarcticus IMCC3135 TaxID=1192854 RepID=A0A2Z2NWB7_9GAMM|nr:LysR family transcriptional regulator [Granulosicoccus antarcticus]ASJ74008.1 HTH-type transcriptional regulator DmlR [Granulosicoccus antarcticus IMCC3135]
MILNNIALFLQIVESGSLTAAGREAGLSSTTVSERLAALEAHYGVVLLNRTTRAISLTEEGRTLVEGAKRVLGEVEELDTRIRHGAQTLTGPIRISAPIDIGRAVVSDTINHFVAEHPQISIELLLSDGYVDVVNDGIDIALRFGRVSDSSLRVRHICLSRRLVCASPAYLEQFGTPMTPDELTQHNCLIMRFGRHLDNVWRFGDGATQQMITVRGNRVANDGALVRQWGVAGLGIVLKSEHDVREDIRSGKLVEILASSAPPAAPLQMLFPPSRAQPARVRSLADQLASRLGASRLIPDD